jgi:hypothetical protein
MKKKVALTMLIALIAVALVSTLSFAKKPGPGGGGGGPGICGCANLDNPVICDDGKTYPNPASRPVSTRPAVFPPGGGGCR